MNLKIANSTFFYHEIDFSFLLINIILDIFEHFEKDLNHEVIINGPLKFASILFHYNIISSNDLELMEYLSALQPPENATLVLIAIVKENTKHPVTYEALLNCLEKMPSLNYLYKKIKILG